MKWLFLLLFISACEITGGQIETCAINCGGVEKIDFMKGYLFDGPNGVGVCSCRLKNK